jgi:YD repeat-containing protein
MRSNAAGMVVRARVRAWIVGVCRVGRLALVGGLVSLFALTASAVGSSYLYDELGRLIEVTTDDGNTSQYKYDISGNLVSVTSVGGTVTVADFTPSSGKVASQVVITGSGFSTTPSQNSVTFGNSTSVVTVTAATTTQLTVTVPSDATTGLIKVSAGGKSGTSAATFTVLTSGTAPSITSFSPTIGPAGTAVQITGRNFDVNAVNDELSFGATQAVVTSPTSTSMQTSVPVSAGSGSLQLRTPAGHSLSSQDFYAIPPAYAASSVVAAPRIPMGGTATTPALAAGQVPMALFDLNAGQQAAFSVTPGTGLTLASINKIVFTDPLGQTFVTGKNTDLTTGVMVLPVPTLAGTYSAIVDLGTTSSGSLTLGLAPPTTANISIDQGSALHVTSASPAAPRVVTFTNVTAGKQVTLNVTANVAFTGVIRVVGPDGNTVVDVPGVAIAAGATYSLQPQLAMAGTYTIVIGSYQGVAYDLSLALVSSATAGMTINGTPATLNVSQANGTQTVTVAVVAGQQITVAAVPQLAPAGFTANMMVRDASGQGMPIYPTPPQGQDPLVVPIPTFLTVNPAGVNNSGLYTVQLKPTSNKAAAVQVTVSTPVSGGTLASTGQALPVAPTLAGQGASVVFLGSDRAMTLNVSAAGSTSAYQAQVLILDQFGLPLGGGGVSATLLVRQRSDCDPCVPAGHRVPGAGAADRDLGVEQRRADVHAAIALAEDSNSAPIH